jgi:hypothetical protein
VFDRRTDRRGGHLPAAAAWVIRNVDRVEIRKVGQVGRRGWTVEIKRSKMLAC